MRPPSKACIRNIWKALSSKPFSSEKNALFTFLAHVQRLVSIACLVFAMSAVCLQARVARAESSPDAKVILSLASSPLNHPLSDLRHTSFTARDGATSGVTSLAQSPEGFL